MNYVKVLPATGATGLVVGGLVMSHSWVVAAAIALVVSAAVTIRMYWRDGKDLNQV